MRGVVAGGGSGGGGAGTGDVVGPAAATDNAIARYNGATGESIQDSSVLISDAGLVQVGGATSSFPGMKASSVALALRLADDSAATSLLSTRRQIVSNDGDPISVANTGATFKNLNAASSVQVDLPASPALGTFYRFVVVAAQDFIVTTAGSQVIRVGASATSAGGTVTAAAAGAVIEIEYVATDLWIGISSGTWTFA